MITSRTDDPLRQNGSLLGQTLAEPLAAMTRWAETHIGAVMDAQQEFDARSAKQA